MKRLDDWGEYQLFLMSSAEDGAAFWAKLGPFFASRAVERELGDGMYDSPDHQWIVAERSGQVAGFAGLHTAQLAKQGTVWLDWSYVLPEHRGHGMYTHLFEVRMQVAMGLAPQLIRGATAGEISERLFGRYGFALYSQRGRWGYYEKTLEVAP
jgi:GNAT superfamily N-acetyltransferase